MPGNEASPMLEQYRRIKAEHRDQVLFFRLGDFYEMFQEDALEVSSLLNLTLTSRNGLPMCGVPYHAARSYIARLLRRGKKVAVCEQLSAPGKGLIERKVVEVITPGTTIEEDFLEQGASNYLAALAFSPPAFSFACIDLSTGEFFATSFSPEKAAAFLAAELERLDITELVVSESLLEENPSLAKIIGERPGLVVNRWADWLFDLSRGKDRLIRQFNVLSLKSFGLDDTSPEILSAGVLLDYLDGTAKSLIPHVRTLQVYGGGEFTGMDEATQRNLELTRNFRDGSGRFTLIEVLDETKSSMGRRLLKKRLLQPLRNEERIHNRLDLVEKFYRDQGRLSVLRDLLSKTPDLERLCSRLAMDRAHGKDMVSIRNALAALLRIHEVIFPSGESKTVQETPRFESAEAAALGPDDFAALEAVRSELERGLCENPSILFTEGNLIRDGYSPELDRLKALKDSGRGMLEGYLEEEKAATGIPSLKIRYNRMIGYFFEVTKIHLSRVPKYFIRRQGMATGERFSTERLAKLESDISGAQDRIVDLEKELFLELRLKAKAELARFSALAKFAAELDAAQSLAWAATRRGWTRPGIGNEKRLSIIEGRHPVVEANLPSGEFIPNDLELAVGEGEPSGETAERPAFALITGPNMAGKSTYLRQAALITVMAQMGSFVPAREAFVGIADRIYCRVGASDNLARGESTFLSEMNETAYILRTATDRSLVIMDEVGRGTGTSDGLAIAWAVCEELLERRPRTLFATHYHELSLLSHPRLVNRSMDVLERGGEIVFLRKLKEGPAAESYGLHVAALAGLPETVLARAALLLENIRAAENTISGAIRDAALYPAHGALPGAVCAAPATEARGFPGGDMVRELAALDINVLSPLEALNLLERLREKALSLSGPKSRAGTKHIRLSFQKAEPSKKPMEPKSGELSLFE